MMMQMVMVFQMCRLVDMFSVVDNTQHIEAIHTVQNPKILRLQLYRIIAALMALEPLFCYLWVEPG